MDAAGRWQQLLRTVRRLVVKVGTSTLTGGGIRLDPPALDRLVEQLTALHGQGLDVILVTSGAIVTGASRLNIPAGPRTIRERQALAAVGQAMLMHEYEHRFTAKGLVVAQMLLTGRDFDQRRAYLNARNTIEELLQRRALPIVNENDTVATDEIRIGDNDTLSAQVAALAEAELLCILSDVDGLYTADPHADPAAVHVDTVEQLTGEIERFARQSSSSTGVGGMVTKLTAARIAGAAGAGVAIVDGRASDVILRVLAGEALGTRFLPSAAPLRGRRRWIALRTRVHGRVRIDRNAARAILSGGRSLLPVGVLGVEGDFEAGDMVAVIGPDGTELARGVASHNHEDLDRIKGRPSQEVRDILGEASPEAMHRSNMVILR